MTQAQVPEEIAQFLGGVSLFKNVRDDYKRAIVPRLEPRFFRKEEVIFKEGDKGDALYDPNGAPLPVWEERQKLLFEYEQDLLRSEEMCKAAAQLQLFEPFTMQAVPNEGTPVAMTGMHRIAEQKLGELPADKVKELTQTGILARIYAHLISLNNFGRLLDRRTAATAKT